MCGNFVCNTKPLSVSLPYITEGRSHNAMFPADPVPAPRPALLAVLLARPAAVHAEMAAVSAALSVAALTPPVPSLAIAAIASAGMVRDLWDIAPARTVAILVVLSTEA